MRYQYIDCSTEQALEEEEAKSALKDQLYKKDAENASRARKEQLRFRKAEIEQKEKASARTTSRDKRSNLVCNVSKERGTSDLNVERNTRKSGRFTEPWKVAADIINSTWREAMLIENQQFVVSATALHTSKEDRSEGVFDFFSSESDVDWPVSDDEELAARSQLRLMQRCTVQS